MDASYSTDGNGQSFGYFAVIQAGFRDGVGPGAMAALLILLIFIFPFACKSGNPYKLGWRYIWGVFFFKCLLVLGIFDSLLQGNLFWKALDYAYFILAALSLSLGGLLLRDRWIYGRSGDPARLTINILDFRAAVLVPQPVKIPGGEPIRWLLKLKGKIISLMTSAVSFIIGGTSALISTAWTQGNGAGTIFYEFIWPGKTFSALMLLVTYGIFFVIPLAVVWVALIRFLKSRIFEAGPQRYVPKIQIVLAALFIGFAVGIFTFYI